MMLPPVSGTSELAQMAIVSLARIFDLAVGGFAQAG